MTRQTESTAGPEPAGHRAPVVRFGPFEANLRAETVRLDGSRVRLQQQPFQVLAFLLERPGEIVTREELRQRLWPDGLYVDFEHGLNTAVKKLRSALDDGPEQPRYVETVRGRGYRFIAGVEWVEPPLAGGQPAPAARRAGRLWSGLITLVMLAAVAGTLTVWSRRSTDRRPLRAVPLTSYPGAEYQPTFSPDGTHVAFTWHRPSGEDIYVQPVGIPEPRPLAQRPEVEHSPAWSPDGRWIAFIRDPVEPEEAARVIVVPPSGGPERLVTTYVGRRSHFLWTRQLTWAPDCRHLVLSRPDEGGLTWSLLLVDVARGQARPLIESSGVDQTPALSPDGRALAFTHFGQKAPEIRLLPLTPDLGPAAHPSVFVSEDDGRPFGLDGVFMPAWRPDGREIVFAAFPVRSRLYRRGLGGGGAVRPLPEGTESTQMHLGALLDPTFRPGTGQLVCASWDSRGFDIVRVELDGVPVARAPAFKSSRGEVDPTLSPDGETVAFTSSRGGVDEIWISGLDGTGLRRLSTRGAERSQDPAWSPDGRWIAYAAAVDGNLDVYVSPVAENGISLRLTHDPAADVQPAWSPAGDWVYFASEREGSTRIWRLPAAGGTPEPVSRPDAHQPALSSDGRFLYFARGSPGNVRVWRMPTAGGEEEVVVEAVNLFTTWQLDRDGIWFLTPTLKDGKAALVRRALATSRDRRLAFLEGPINDGLTVSRDGRIAFYARVSHPSADLVMLEGW